MGEPDDLDLRRPDEPEAPEAELERLLEPGPGPAEELDASNVGQAAEPFPLGLALGAAAMVAFVGALGYLLLRPSRPAPPTAAASATARVPASPAPSLAASVAPAPDESITLPALDDSDGVVRELAARLSPDPRLAAWLGAGDLVRRFTAIAVNVASGESPRPHAAWLAPPERFAVTRRRGRVVADPAGYARYDALVDTFVSLDTAGAARVVRLLSPLLAAAAREQGRPEGGFDDTLDAAITSLLAVPVSEGEPTLRPVTRAVVLYEYEDARLEALTPAQKQLLRMGPRNVRRVQAKLRELGSALGLRLAATP